MPRSIAILLPFLCLLAYGGVRAQTMQGDNTPRIHREFPFQTMWDDAVLASAQSGKPAVAFDLDLVDSASIRVAKQVIASKRLQMFLHNNFEVALNDFASDPAPAVGMDSLRNLGWRLSGLEKSYGIARRPCVIVIGPNKQEIDRIVFPETMSATKLERQLDDILHDRNTLHTAVQKFWRDTTNLKFHWQLVDLFEQRSNYDSVVHHLDWIANDASHPADARKAALRVSDLELRVQGRLEPIETLMATLGIHGEDSTLHYALLAELQDFFKQHKKPDSVASTYERMMTVAGKRDPDLLNEEAWYLGSQSSLHDEALRLVNEALTARPNEADYLDTRALIESNLEQYDDAIRDEEKAVTFAPVSDRKDFETQLQHYRDVKEKAQAELNEDSKPKH